MSIISPEQEVLIVTATEGQAEPARLDIVLKMCLHGMHLM